MKAAHEESMMALVHHQILEELRQGGRTDAVTCVTAVLFNLIILAVNSSVCWEIDISKNGGLFNFFIPVVFLAITFSINASIFDALQASSDTKMKLLNNLMSMYTDTGVAKYYDASVLRNFKHRYQLFKNIISCFAAIAVGIPALRMVTTYNYKTAEDQVRKQQYNSAYKRGL